MHIHIHNVDNAGVIISPTHWAAAGITGHHVTFGETAEEFARQAPSMDILLGTPGALRRLDLFSAPKLRLVQSTSAGVDSLQPFHTIPPWVQLLNNRGTHADKAGEFALMAILMLVNLMPGFATSQRHRRWERQTAGLASAQRLTIVGLGTLGGAAAAQAKRLNMAITGIRNHAVPHPDCQRTLTMASLDSVLPETDILLLACPLTPQTQHLLNRDRLALLPSNAGVINIGRGGLIEQPALLAALNDGELAGAVLDVFEIEPIPTDDPVWTTRNLIITPHMSSDDLSTYSDNTLAAFKANLQAYTAGLTPPTLVDRLKGY